MDRGQITALEATYRSILRGEKKWLLLQYSDSIDLRRLTLCSQGSNGLDELEASFHKHKVQHAVYREDESPSTGLIIITYIPTFISGIERARALVNARHLLTTLEESWIHSFADGGKAVRANPEPIEPTLNHLHDVHPAEEIRRACSETNNSNNKARFLPQRSKKLIGQILGRNRGHRLSGTNMETPPVPPPKDNPRQSRVLQTELEPEMVASYPLEANNWPISDEQYLAESRSLYVPLRGKWGVTMMSDPEERARFRSETEAKRRREEEEAKDREQERQAKIRQEKEAIIQQNLEDQARQVATLQQDLTRAAEERQRREHFERVEEEHSHRLSELKKRVEKEKRLEMHRQMERWRKEQLCREEQARRDLEEAKRKQTKEMLQRISRAQAQLGRSGRHGWVGIQTSKSLTWKRRIFKLDGGKIHLYRDEKERSPVIEVDIKTEVRSIKEWDEGYEELKAIPHSFVVELAQRGEIWMMYTDTEDEKYMILAYVYQIAGWSTEVYL
ncbi:hypothetical protein M378DRAFT_10654 [Amanita muscaria Koide BX008]|uniref:ADF-H domain-containing protein n=1 Tax=Amanita muscaria (strain Koide BX008) TaxID=946122 RepID=A0A0C2W3V5_AMAMK|nr:hypothetical protein M378DRAFT_17607 [Amanita muscaria Koide BX008]KIL65518.1 hypothetical protein M378DRAFT_10654 [Amanita muscaria Koide BX008]